MRSGGWSPCDGINVLIRREKPEFSLPASENRARRWPNASQEPDLLALGS